MCLTLCHVLPSVFVLFVLCCICRRDMVKESARKEVSKMSLSEQMAASQKARGILYVLCVCVCNVLCCIVAN